MRILCRIGLHKWTPVVMFVDEWWGYCVIGRQCESCGAKTKNEYSEEGYD